MLLVLFLASLAVGQELVPLRHLDESEPPRHYPCAHVKQCPFVSRCYDVSCIDAPSSSSSSSSDSWTWTSSSSSSDSWTWTSSSSDSSSSSVSTYEGGVCHYERLPIDECCLDSSECCAFAAPHQIGICDKNCTCQFVTALQCTQDSDCDATLSGVVCKQQGECFYPMCEAGLCTCYDGTNQDLDGDGVLCPEDCDDRDPSVSVQLTCFRDADNDQYPDCTSHCYVSDDDDSGDDDDHSWTYTTSSDTLEGSDSWTWTSSSSSSSDHKRRHKHREENCMQICVEPGHTCPYGWTDPSDEYRFSKRRSAQNTTQPCPPHTPRPDPSTCDCCDHDARAFPGSMYVSNRPNRCHDLDYNCDGRSTRLACCDDGEEERREPLPHEENVHGRRTLWHETNCYALGREGCGGCSTHGGKSSLVIGWACEEQCDGGGKGRKRSLGGGKGPSPDDDDDDTNGAECPGSCQGECVCVDEETLPELGECAKMVTSCLEVRPNIFGDDEECCAVAIQ